MERLRLPDRQPRRLPGRAEHRSRHRPAPPVHERRGLEPSGHLRDHRLDRRRAQLQHREPRLRRGHLPHALRPARHLVQDVAATSSTASTTGRARGNDTVFIDGTKPERRAADDDDPQHRPRQRQRHGQPDRRPATASSSSRPPAARSTGDPVAHSLPARPTTTRSTRTGSTLPLVIIGGCGNDTIRGGQGNDIILGDARHRAVRDAGAPDTLLAQFGFGGRGDVIDAQRATLGTPIDDPRWVYTYAPDMTIGGADTIYGNGGEDILIGGAGERPIDGGTADDLIFGDQVQLFRRDVDPTVTGDITNPRFQTRQRRRSTPPTGLPTDATNTNATGSAQNYRDPNGTYAPDWAEYQITLYQLVRDPGCERQQLRQRLHRGRRGQRHDLRRARQRRDPGRRLDRLRLAAAACTGVGATLEHRRRLRPTASARRSTAPATAPTTSRAAAATTSSSATRARTTSSAAARTSSASTASNAAAGRQRHHLRRLGHATIGARATQATRRANGHAHDSDAIVGDNGDIIRLVGTGAHDRLPQLQLRQLLDATTKIVAARACTLLDYTPGGPDFDAAARCDRHRRRST